MNYIQNSPRKIALQKSEQLDKISGVYSSKTIEPVQVNQEVVAPVEPIVEPASVADLVSPVTQATIPVTPVEEVTIPEGSVVQTEPVAPESGIAVDTSVAPTSQTEVTPKNKIEIYKKMQKDALENYLSFDASLEELINLELQATKTTDINNSIESPVVDNVVAPVNPAPALESTTVMPDGVAPLGPEVSPVTQATTLPQEPGASVQTNSVSSDNMFDNIFDIPAAPVNTPVQM